MQGLGRIRSPVRLQDQTKNARVIVALWSLHVGAAAGMTFARNPVRGVELGVTPQGVKVGRHEQATDGQDRRQPTASAVGALGGW